MSLSRTSAAAPGFSAFAARASIPPVKGVILAGGTGSRLAPLTRITSKHLLPLYDGPMVTDAVEALVEGGMDEMMLVTGGMHAGSSFACSATGRSTGSSNSSTRIRNSRAVSRTRLRSPSASSAATAAARLRGRCRRPKSARSVQFLNERSAPTRVDYPRARAARRVQSALPAKRGERPSTQAAWLSAGRRQRFRRQSSA